MSHLLYGPVGGLRRATGGAGDVRAGRVAVSVLIAAALIGMHGVANAQAVRAWPPTPEDAPPGAPRVPIAVARSGSGSNWSLEVFRAELLRLWRDNGVDLVLLDRGVPPFEGKAPTPGPTLIMLSDGVPTLLERAGGAISPRGLGTTLRPAGPVFVRVERVRQLVAACTSPAGPFVTLSLILARVVAHELGHVLLGTGEHAETGLMRESFGCEDTEFVAGEQYRLTPGEFAAVHANLQATVAAAKAVPAVPPSPQ